MNRIQVLTPEISNKIAAGEVVEKPANIVKELIENAIDAKASQITVEIKKGGKDYIRITDDGVGIQSDDILLAFERHATSKIKELNDIYAIESLGFRGEALASIASISQIELISKTDGEEMGTKVVCHGGKVIENTQTGTKTGTTLIVKNVFYNTPARLKFLKSNTAEQNAINDLVNKMAISHPEISLRYIVDSKVIFVTPGSNDLYKTLYSIYEKFLCQNLIDLSVEVEGIKINGYISNLQYNRGNKKLQTVFINGRYIQSKTIYEAIQLSYKTLLPINRHAVCFLNITIDPKIVDVNIHPQKTEVKFENEGAIKQALYQAIHSRLLEINQVPKVKLTPADLPKEKFDYKKPFIAPEVIKDNAETKTSQPVKKDIFDKTLIKSDNVIVSDVSVVKEDNEPAEVCAEPPVIKDTFQPPKKAFERPTFEKKVSQTNIKKNTDKKVSSFKSQVKHDDQKSNHQVDLDAFNLDVSLKELDNKAIEPIIEPLIETLEKTETIYDDLRIIGQFMKSYIICEKGKTLYMIDQHAAHEKVLYETFLEDYRNHKIMAQGLLEPIPIEMSYEDLENVKANKELFDSLGMRFDDFGDQTILLREVPMIFNQPATLSFFWELVDQLTSGTLYDYKVEDIIQKSCKKAIKAHDYLDNMEINALIKQLKTLKEPYTCPHGRPIIVAIELSELERKFKRT